MIVKHITTRGIILIVINHHVSLRREIENKNDIFAIAACRQK